MFRKINRVLFLPLFYFVMSCNAQTTQEGLEQKVANAIGELKKQFPINSDWEIVPGDSANSFTLSSKEPICAYLLTDDMDHDSVNVKFRALYYVRPALSSRDSIKMRRLQDSVTKASFALEEKYGIGIADSKGHIKGLSELSPAQKKAYKEEDERLSKLSPVMPAFSSPSFSIYIQEPVHNTFCDDKLESGYELMQYGIANYFRNGKFNYDELQQYRKKEQEELKRRQSELKQ